MTKRIHPQQAAYLAVKIKSLAAEVAIIRADERRHAKRHSTLRAAQGAIAGEKALADRAKFLGRLADDHHSTMCGLHLHRIGTVRAEARAAQIAYGFLRGVPYRAIERTSKSEPDFEAVLRNAVRFGSDRDKAAVLAALKAWLDEPGQMPVSVPTVAEAA